MVPGLEEEKEFFFFLEGEKLREEKKMPSSYRHNRKVGSINLHNFASKFNRIYLLSFIISSFFSRKGGAQNDSAIPR